MNLQYKQRGFVRLGQFIRDLQFSLRMLRKNPGFTALAVLTLGLGIGAVTTMFGVHDALFLNPFPYPDADRIAYVWSRCEAKSTQPLSVPDFQDILEQNTSFSEIGAYSQMCYNLGLDNPVSIYGVRCTAGVLRTFGMKPSLGRFLEEADEKQGAAPVAVISYSLWSRFFASDPKTLGRTIRLDGIDTTIVGIMPADFEFSSAWYDGHDFELWTPLSFGSTPLGRDSHWMLGIGRLKDGVTMEAADAEIKTIGARLAKEHPDTNLHKPFVVRSFRQQTTENIGSGTKFIFGTVWALLLVACANVASLLLARGNRRQGEFGARLALGGTRWDIIRLMLSESLILALLGGVVGIILADWGLVMMRHIISAAMITGARREALQINGTVLAFSVGLAFLTSLIFGMLPAVTASRTSVAETIKSDGRSQTGSRLRHRFLRFLVAGQIAIAVMLGNGAVLMSSSYLNVLKDNRDLNTDHVVTAGLALRGDRYKEDGARQAFVQDLFERVRGLPGVAGVAITTKLPLEGGSNSNILVDNEAFDPAIMRPLAETSAVSPEYFSVMGISLLQGRYPGAQDAETKINGVAVNRALAEKCWPGKDPIGRQIRYNDAKPFFQAIVVGVVADVRQWGAEMPVIPEIYFPYSAYAVQISNSATLTVRTSGDAHNLIPPLQAMVAALDRDLPLANVRTMKEVVTQSTALRRLLAQLVGLFMGITLILTAVGIYGTLSYTVSQRQREIGIRMAMGAMRRQILRFVFRQAAVWVISGLIAGLFLTVGLSFLMRSAFYGVSPLNPLLLFIGLAFVSIAAGAACFLPALRAARMDPMEALRCE